MRAWTRKLPVVVLCLASAFVAVPGIAEGEAPAPAASHTTFLDTLQDLWAGLSGLWEPVSEPAVLPPVESAGVVPSCEAPCSQQSDDIDPNG